ncbi:phosphotransferase family protein [Ktedonospora formicarum]|uniref:Aminoglycoside phosphotransferase n=1 Tax=Ktedonospora formicarum TaxID=2778364 RepID=A0A8J3I8W3_9CHLR|nr:phosphotransferase [Ktedonospora formicarum]GHO48172.1 aminoglycoside phosphotransferase [Ktedonospora formicarum]
MDLAHYTEVIAREFPELEVRTARPITAGWDSFVLDVNDELIFRFPLRADVMVRLSLERRLLPALEPYLSTPIPHFLYFGQDSDSYPFVGYRKIDGVPLIASSALTPPRLDALAPAIATFLSELHSFPLANATGFEERSPAQWQEVWRQDYRERYDDLRAKVFSLLDERLREGARALWEGFLDDDANFLFQPVLIHRDLGCEHIFCDPERGTVTGVIDWGDVSIGDAALDFVGLHWGHGWAFVELVLAHYKSLPDATFWRRMDFYLRYAPYSELLYGVYSQKSDFIERGIQGLRNQFKK